jgi:hypothetical protein
LSLEGAGGSEPPPAVGSVRGPDQSGSVKNVSWPPTAVYSLRAA